MSDEKTALIIATLFLARDTAHREHLKVTGPGSYAKHKALESFYEGIVGLADSLAEAYQGRFETLLDIPLVSADEDMPILNMLRSQREWIRETRYEAVSKDETPLHNIIDEIESLYFSTIYKLRFLA